MKLLLSKIIYFLNYIKNFRTITKFKKINNKLHKSIEDREVDRIILKGQILKMVRAYLRVDARYSKFIPIESRNNTEIIERILAEFGDAMKSLDLKINNKLELV